MIVGSILLTKSNEYLTAEGTLPTRPKYDKLLLTELCKGELVSQEGYDLLPPSIQQICMVDHEPSMPITISELDKCDLLIVSRSSMATSGEGKKFRLDNFKLIVKDRKCELWMS